MKLEIRKIDEIKEENADLWKQMRVLKMDLQRLKKDGPIRDRVSQKDGEFEITGSKITGRLTFDDNDSPVAGPSRNVTTTMMGLSGGVATAAVVTPVPENKREVSEHMSNIVKKLKEVRRRKGPTEEMDSTPTMDWEVLPQRSPRPKSRVIANIQLAPPRSSSELDRSDSETIKGKRKGKGKKRSKVSKKGVDESLTNSTSGRNRKNNTKVEDPVGGEEKTDFAPAKPKKGFGNAKTRASGPARRLPKTAAVSITGRTKDFSYKDALMKARRYPLRI